MGIREYKETGSYTGVLNVFMGNLVVGLLLFFLFVSFFYFFLLLLFYYYYFFFVM